MNERRMHAYIQIPNAGSLSPAASSGDDDGADSITNAHVVRGS